MGGARCSYKNCSQRSDQVTHMFHYPVFDKMRCHQWITNSQKQTYLNLRLSQLKNRMICQHHFKEDNFMNEMKNKLKNTAIPTLDGPYCSQTHKPDTNEMQIDVQSEPLINIDDIENEFTPHPDRRAHLMVKYGDFLTNDVTDVDISTTDYKSTSILLQDKGMIFNRNNVKNQTNSPALRSKSKKVIPPIRDSLPSTTALNNRSSGGSTQLKVLHKSKKPIYELKEENIGANNHNQTKSDTSISQESKLAYEVKVDPDKSLANPIPLSKKVKIISEKHISEPLKISPGELQPVSPSLIIKVPQKHHKANIQINDQDVKTFYIDEKNIAQRDHSQDPGNPQEDMVTTTCTQTPSQSVTEQMHLDSQNQCIIYADQMGYSDIAIPNVDSYKDIKSTGYLITEVSPNNQQLEQETSIFTNLDQNLLTDPTVEFVSSSLSGPSVFTLKDVPQVSMSIPDQSYNTSQGPHNGLLSMDSQLLISSHEPDVPLSTASHIVGDVVDMPIISDRVRSPLVEKQSSKISSPMKALTRHKMPPEKLAAIEKKRKYNMKIRDIINSCLNNMDNEPDIEKLTANMKQELGNKKVEEHLSKQSSGQGDVIAYLETRLKRLEDNLLNRIEDNTQEIHDIKRSLKRSNPNKKSTSTQTYISDELNKKNLYQQISQYLTPEINSLIYEELFINSSVNVTVTKRRKRNYQ